MKYNRPQSTASWGMMAKDWEQGVDYHRLSKERLKRAQDAIRHAARMAKIEGDYRVDPPGAAKKPIEKILESLGGEKHRPLAARLGPWGQIKGDLEHQLRVLSSLNDPMGIYARMPFELSLR